LYVTRRKTESHAEDANAQTDAANQCILEEMGQSESGFGATLRVLQLLPRAYLAESYARHAVRNHGSHLEHPRIGGICLNGVVFVTKAEGGNQQPQQIWVTLVT